MSPGSDSNTEYGNFQELHGRMNGAAFFTLYLLIWNIKLNELGSNLLEVLFLFSEILFRIIGKVSLLSFPIFCHLEPVEEANVPPW